MQGLIERLRERLAETDDPVLQEMLEARIVEVGEPPPEEPQRSPYETVRDDLERIYVQLRALHETGPAFRKRWASDRTVNLRHHGWSEEDFYAEMDRRRHQQEKP